MTDRKEVLLRASSVSKLRQLVHRMLLDLDCGGPRRQDDGAVTITAFVTPEDLDGIRESEGVEVVDVVDVRSAQDAEIGTGDRFDGGRTVPRGTGRKVRAGA